MQSATFSGLIKNAGITDKNYNKIISFGENLSGTSKSGKIFLAKGKSEDISVIALTHELTNVTNLSTLVGLSTDVGNGKITPSEYAEKVIETEAEGIVNQILVANELKIKFEKSSEGMNDLLKQYSKGKMNCLK